jgi:hypothetical protein
VPGCQGGPCWPRRADLAGSWWACRSIELASAVVADITELPNGEISWELPFSKTDQAALGASRSRKCSCGTVPGVPSIVTQDLRPRCVLLAHVTWVSKVFKALLANNQQVPLFPTEMGDFITKANIVNHIELGATSVGEPTRSRAWADLWSGHAYRRGIVHYLALSGVQVSLIQSLLRRSSTSTAIIRCLGEAIVHSSASLAEEAALGTTLNSVRAEIETSAAQLRSQQIAASALQKQRGPPDLGGSTKTTQQDALATTTQSSSSNDKMPYATIPPASTRAFVVCTRETPMRGKLHVRRPHDGGITCCNWAFLASIWASVVQDIPKDVKLGARDWCPSCATFYARSADEEQTGRIESSSSSQSTSSFSSS